MNKFALNIGLSTVLTACSGSVEISSPSPKTPDQASSKTAPVTPESIKGSESPSFRPHQYYLSHQEILTYYLSCEASVSAHVGYVSNLSKNLGMADNALELPCHLIHEIDQTLLKIRENCALVLQPSNSFVAAPEKLKIEEKMTKAAQENLQQATEMSKKIHKDLPACFPDDLISL